MKKIALLLFMLFSCMILLLACGQETPLDIGTQPPEVEKSIDEQLANKKDDKDISPTDDKNMNTQQVVLYFSDQNLIKNYRVDSEIPVQQGDDIRKAALEAWIKGPDHDQLAGLVHPETRVQSIDDVSGVAYVSFSQEIQKSNLGSSGELLLAEQVAMIMQQFGLESTQILIEGKVVESLKGHLYIGEPIKANKPEQYSSIVQNDTK